MSAFQKGQFGMMLTTLIPNDLREMDIVNPTRSARGLKAPFEDGMLWPSARLIGSAMMTLTEDAAASSGRFAPWSEQAGNAGRKRLSGTTKDSNGSVLGGVAVQAIRADGSSCDGTSTSDPSGYYVVPVSNPSGNYKVDAYKAGSPDVAGTTINTLVPV